MQSIVASVILGLACLTEAYPKTSSKRGTGDFSLSANLMQIPSGSSMQKRDGEVNQVVGHSAIVSMTIGGQEMQALFDSGAGLTTARNTSANPNHGFYDPSKSPTAHIVDGGSWQETFNTETVGGPVYHDDVTLGSVDASQAVVFPCDSRCKPGDYANFGMARGFFVTYQVNGSDTNDLSFFGTIEGSLTTQLWTLDLQRITQTGTFDFGFINDTKYTGDIAYVDVDDDDTPGGFWQTHVTGYSFSNGGPSDSSRQLNFLVDTGTSTFGLPSDIVSSYFGNVDGATQDSTSKAWSFPCSSELGDFTFTIGGTTLVVAGDNFRQGSQSDQGTCGSLLVNDDNETANWGTPFQQGLFIVHHYGHAGSKDQMGFANKVTQGA